MYVARDKDGDLYFYREKPVKCKNRENWTATSGYADFYKIDASLFPKVSWEDEEPTEVELVKKQE